MIVMGLILCLIHYDEYMVGIKICKPLPLFMLFGIYLASSAELESSLSTHISWIVLFLGNSARY